MKLAIFSHCTIDEISLDGQVFERAGGAVMLLEKELTPEKLSSLVEQLPLSLMKEKLKTFKQKEKKQDLSTLILNYL